MTTETGDPVAAETLEAERKARRKARRRKARAAEENPRRMPAIPAALPEGAAPIRDFALILGAMKSGTTSLYHYLAAHPAIATGKKKEPDFFTTGRNWKQGYDAYYALWPDFDPETHRYALEASTNYTKFPQRPRAPQRMKRFATERGARYRFFYILRNPVDRIESHLAHNIARRERDANSEAIDPARLESALAVSRYASQLKRYARHFPREDLMILDFDELTRDPRALLDRAFGFLGLETPADLEIRPPANPRRDAHGSAGFRLGDAPRAQIRDALRDDVAELRDRFGVDVSRWNIL